MIRQVLTVLLLGLRSLLRRFRAALAIVVALVCLSVLPLALLTSGASLRASYLSSAAPDRVMILSNGSHRQVDSQIPPQLMEKIRLVPGIRWWHGRPLVDLQISAAFHPAKRSRPENGNAQLRGIGPLGFVMRPELKLLTGRLPKPGSDEVIAGEQAVRKFSGTNIGGVIHVAGVSWRVVGIFRTGANLDGDVIGDAAALKDALHSPAYQAILLSLQSPSALPQLQQILRPLPFIAMREREYYTGLWSFITNFPYLLVCIFLLLVGSGAVAATGQCVHVAISNRAREIVILRVIGFNGAMVAAAVVLEAVLLACLGALIGAIIVWLWVEGYPYNGGIEGGVFRVTLTWPSVIIALGWALAVGLMGALWPAMAAARGTVTDALRDL